MSELTNVIQQTSDYDKFSFLSNNREYNRKHVENLKKAFVENGNLTMVQPILVNENYEIIDGQHRFVAAQELGQPLFYTMVSGLGIENALSMNILHRSWTSEDYARSYALSGKKGYIDYLNLREEFPFASHSIMLSYIANAVRQTPHKKFREGDLVIEDLVTVRQRLENLGEIREIAPMHTSTHFAEALLKIMNSDLYKQAQMVAKLKTYPNRLQRFASTSDYLKALEDLYNFRNTEANHIRLY